MLGRKFENGNVNGLLVFLKTPKTYRILQELKLVGANLLQQKNKQTK